jgi:hypothetical protein
MMPKPARRMAHAVSGYASIAIIPGRRRPITRCEIKMTDGYEVRTEVVGVEKGSVPGRVRRDFA